MVAREVPDQRQAHQAHAALMAVKRQILLACAKGTSFNNDFEHAVRASIPEVLRQRGATAQGLGLRFHVQISMRSWIAPPLHTPQSSSLDSTLGAWRRLAPFRHAAGSRASPCRVRLSPLEAEAQWHAFREAYLDVLVGQGQCRDQVAARLDDLEDAAQPLRERRLEQWNRQCMAGEDNLRHRGWRAKQAARGGACSTPEERAMRHFERQQLRERRQSRRERRALAREDGLARARRRQEARETRAKVREAVLLERRRARSEALGQAHSLRLIGRLLRRWRWARKRRIRQALQEVHKLLRAARRRQQLSNFATQPRKVSTMCARGFPARCGIQTANAVLLGG